jgi:hypothetical protein
VERWRYSEKDDRPLWNEIRNKNTAAWAEEKTKTFVPSIGIPSNNIEMGIQIPATLSQQISQIVVNLTITCINFSAFNVSNCVTSISISILFTKTSSPFSYCSPFQHPFIESQNHTHLHSTFVFAQIS